MKLWILVCDYDTQENLDPLHYAYSQQKHPLSLQMLFLPPACTL